jgi:acylphosphatase
MVYMSGELAMADERLHATVRGRVQGVSFRYNTVLKANEFGVRGWVRNRYDGSVEVVAEGTRPALERLLAWLHEGSLGARVTEVESSWWVATGEFEDFSIR